MRSRLLKVIAVFLLTSFGGYFIYPQILSILFRIYDQRLFYTSPTAGIDLAFKISIAAGICLSVPFFIYEVFQFIKPVLPKNIQKRLILVVFTSTALLVLGMLFAYFVTLPATLHFLGTFHSENVEYFVSVESYIGFILQYIVLFGMVFQVPLVLLLWNAISKIETKTLMHYQSWVVIGSFIVAAILTPTPDPINQTMMAVPLILLYEVSLVSIYIQNRRNNY